MPRFYLLDCIEACRACTSACYHCAETCLREPEDERMTCCIRLGLECALICSTCADLMSLNSELSPGIAHLCAESCWRCASECEKHPELDACREGEAACRSFSGHCFGISQPQVYP
ncbi:MAG TPA: four-helix bundle copper-binding protein [Chitinophagaceae bacterium]|nr:four-helix bundle copper-binding protein [Chitinophagaceae bacterium]